MPGKHLSQCPQCKEWLEGVCWDGGIVVVFEHKAVIDGKQHHFKLSVEKEHPHAHDAYPKK